MTTDLAKIRVSHLERAALVYLRQSTPSQVEYNRESTARQYALAERACQLGWSKEQAVIIDEDLGLSGARRLQSCPPFLLVRYKRTIYNAGHGTKWEQPLIERLHNLPYITAVRAKAATGKRPETQLELQTRQGAFPLIMSSQRSYLSQTAVNAILARRQKIPVILLARHISRPTGERVAEAGINFIDESGNLHLRLGQHYHTLILGNPDKRPKPEHRRLGAATV
jgi:hypothetical protein